MISNMRNAFINRLSELAKNDKNILMMAGDLGYNVLNKFYDDMPKQFVNAGIAEQNMTSMAAGMALEGKKVYTYSIANFPSLRCLEQIRNDILYHDANVKIISVGAGFGYGSMGMSHHGTDDMGVMRCLPNIIIFSPSDKNEAIRVAELSVMTKKPAYIRLGKGGEEDIHEYLEFNIGESINVVKGNKVAIFTTGPIASEALEATNILNEMSISTALYTFPTVKPIDEEIIKKCGNDFDLIVTVEEHNIIGGLCSAVAEVLAMQKNKAVLRKIGLNDTYISEVGSQKYLRERHNLCSKDIVNTVLDYINLK